MRELDDSLLRINSSPPEPTGTKRLRCIAALGILVSLVLGVGIGFGACWLIIAKPAPPVARLFAEPLLLPNVVFVGHKACDTDAVASAYGAASLFGGHAATCDEQLNGETAWLLARFDVTRPPQSTSPQFADLDWGLTDHGSLAHVPSGVDTDRVVMVIDHHNLADDLVRVSLPILAEFRPWGSASTIVTFLHLEHNREVTDRKVAGLLLGAIISDTLNAQSPTTTANDRAAMNYLAGVLNFKQTDIDEMAEAQFAAMADTSGLTPYEIIRMDFKTYPLGSDQNISVGVGTAFKTSSYSSRKEELFQAMLDVRADLQLTLLFFIVVDVLSLTSESYTLNGSERGVVDAMFGYPLKVKSDGILGAILDTEDRVSRKKQFIPPLTDYLATRTVEDFP